jgi:hypothetical protein
MLSPYAPLGIAAQKYALHYGSTRLEFAAVPDFVYPGMYRVKWPDGQLSDIRNLSRARDAAFSAAQQGRNWRLLRWKPVGDGRTTSLVRQNGWGAA